ncbi:MAG: hypothetical protein LBH32_01145 [Dysgonamonadaceae bacterium]|nr:hypothetical protein [Dysgonamonadaceae bacterium]
MKSKIVISLSFSALIMIACQVYHIQEDEFRNNRIVIYKHDSTVKERKLARRTANITYQRIINKEDEKLRIYFVLNGSANSFNIEKTSYIKVGNKAFEVDISELNVNYRTSTSSVSTTTIVTDSTKTSSSNRVETKTNEWLSNKFVIETPKDIITTIKNADQLLFRFYFGAEPATFILTGKQLKRLREMFSK